eukprot:scaffold40683_cov39-Cyclotella_meneghiniana.AAC.5
MQCFINALATSKRQQIGPPVSKFSHLPSHHITLTPNNVQTARKTDRPSSLYYILWRFGVVFVVANEVERIEHGYIQPLDHSISTCRVDSVREGSGVMACLAAAVLGGLSERGYRLSAIG